MRCIAQVEKTLKAKCPSALIYGFYYLWCLWLILLGSLEIDEFHIRMGTLMKYLEAGGRANWWGGREIILKLHLDVYSRVRVGLWD